MDTAREVSGSRAHDAQGAGLHLGWTPVGLSASVLAPAAVAGIVALIVFMALIGLNSPIVDRPVTFVALRTVFCLGLVAIALVTQRRGSSTRLSALLVALAYAMAIGGLTGIDLPAPFALGRIAAPVALLLVMYVCLAYPSGRIEHRTTRLGFAAAAVMIGALDLATLLLSRVPPVAGPFTRCAGTVCPRNPFDVVSLSSGASTVLSTVLGLGTAIAVLWVAVVTGRRAVQANRLQRRSLTPLFAWTIVTTIGFGGFVAVRAVDEHARLLTPGAVVVAAIIAAMPLAIGLGMARGRLFSMRALESMVVGLGEHPSLIGLQRTMSRAFADPTLELLFWRPTRQEYIDVEGGHVDVDSILGKRAFTEFMRGDQKVAAAVHDPVLAADRDVLEAAGRAVRLALEKDSLETELSTSIAELEASRKRVAWAADEERRRIEQDLHDGAQQELIGLRIKLDMLKEAADEGGTSVAQGLADVGRRIDLAIGHIRDLAKGVYPSVLHDLGLAHALAAIARDMPLEISFHPNLSRRFSPQVETAVYFCCVEALQNVAKHCGAGTPVSLRLSERAGGLQFTIADRGPGFRPELVPASHGVTGMRDRLEAIGGELKVITAPGSGTTVIGRAPAIET